MTSPPRVYLDTSVYVAAMLAPEAEHSEVCVSTLEQAERGEIEVLISALVIAEVVGAPPVRAPQGLPRSVALDRMTKAVGFFAASSFVYVEVGRREGLRAAEIARDHDMKGADSLHVAIAELSGCEALYSLDNDQLKVTDKIDGLKIQRPEGSDQPTLPFA